MRGFLCRDLGLTSNHAMLIRFYGSDIAGLFRCKRVRGGLDVPVIRPFSLIFDTEGEADFTVLPSGPLARDQLLARWLFLLVVDWRSGEWRERLIADDTSADF